ncbi:hypothetical protein M569_05289 [Genlisea aurea]|uniref:Protein TPX2 n=1 Tax=Genlisea aurea TaxID=192259 RepID=S8CQN5_9LAMI|nr:hypothetical protein M569_05289 [Genlisea aurea]
MEEAMEEDNTIGEDEQGVQYFFTAYEVDIDYEFDAVRFFDFSRDESPLEALASESWFDSARTYPASPFVLKMAHGKGSLLDNVNISPKPKGGVIGMCLMNNVLDGEETSHMDESDKGTN